MTKKQSKEADILQKAEPQDILKFGLIPELIGRLPVITTLEPLDKTALVNILTKPKNALTKQYCRLLEMDGVELEFEEDALEAIAEKTLERNTGARGLRSVMEEIIINVMYEAPSDPTVSRVVVTRAAVEHREKPTVEREHKLLKKK